MLRVKYGDNDFGSHFIQACEEFLEWHCKGRRHVRDYNFLKLVGEVSLEEIRKGIVFGAWASYLMECGVRSHVNYCARKSRHGLHKTGYGVDSLIDVDELKPTLEYLDKHTTVKITVNFDENDDNGEACYIDFHNKQVHHC